MDKVPLNIWVDREIFEALERRDKSKTQIVCEALSSYLETEVPLPPNNELILPKSPELHIIEAFIERKIAEFRSQMKIELTLLRERLEDVEGRKVCDIQMHY